MLQKIEAHVQPMCSPRAAHVRPMLCHWRFYSISTMRNNMGAKFTALLHLPHITGPGSQA